MDLAGFPNGRRVFDDVTTIELRAIAGVTFALADSSSPPTRRPGPSPRADLLQHRRHRGEEAPEVWTWSTVGESHCSAVIP